MGNFFQNLGKKAEDAISKAQTAVENGCERFRLSQEIQAQRDSVNALFAELGRLTYHGNAELAGVRPKQDIILDITAAGAKLEALEEELDEMTQPAQNDEPEIELDVETPVSARCFCHKCGQPQPDENVFCHKCGTKLNK